ncbi:uncharacterized protein LOC133199664 [Saccostrea echinata]|uniref:uncharacterized protein LOC133199664 n=1 Tax=Saccostrea echinata TaxID=191078 RepID=UPI002A7F1B15|nr:uncharacterized protein LOC133199664 [Saccostrea echinata]
MGESLTVLTCLCILLVHRSEESSPFKNTDKECRTMLPSGSRSPPRKDKNLFKVAVSDTIYHEAMHHIQVSVENMTDRPIIGVLLQPRLGGCEGPDVDHNVGEFEMIPGNDYFKFLNCRRNPKGAVSTKHWTGKPYQGKIEVNFIITNTKRKLRFRATIIGSHGNLYVNNDSEEIRYVAIKSSDQDDSKECPKLKALPQIAENEAASDYRSNINKFSLLLYILLYLTRHLLT